MDCLTPIDPIQAHPVRRVARGFALVVSILGAGVLAGWFFSVPVLKSVISSYVMKPNTALAFLLSGAALWLMTRRRGSAGVSGQQVPRACAAVVALLGLVRLAQELTGWNVGLDEWLFPEPATSPATAYPGRMLPVTALCFLLSGGALLLASSGRRRAESAAWMLSLVTGIVALLALVGCAYGVEPFYSLPGFTSMAIHTAVGFLLLSAGVVGAYPDRGLMAVMTSDTLGGLLARRLLSAAILVPLLLGGLRLAGQRAGFYGTEMGLALLAVSNVLVLGGLVAYSSLRLAELDTKRLSLMTALGESERHYREFAEGVPVAAYTTDAGGRIAFYNKAAVALWGRRPEPGERWCGSHKLFNRDGTPIAHEECPMAVAILENRPMHGVEASAARPDDSRFNFLAYATPFRDDSGQVVGAMNAMVDITERKQAEEQLRLLNTELEQRVGERTAELEESNQELDAFAHSVSHDLRVPVRGIAGFGEILDTECRDALGERGGHYLDRIMEATRQMQSLIDALLQLSHANRSTIRRQAVDLSALAGQVVGELREAHPEPRVQFTCPLGVVAPGDERLLRVVLVNLLGNAWKYTAKVAEPQVEFGMISDEWPVTSDASHPSPATFFIRDNGVGFDMQYAHRLFGAFQRLHSLSEFEGIGVGLATVQRIIHRHGGKIRAEAKVNQGATFYFTLPE